MSEKKSNQKMRTLEKYNARHDIHTYQDIWSKALNGKFFHLSSFNPVKMNETDIAYMVYNTDYLDVKSYRAIVASKTETLVFIPRNGIWVEQKGNEELRELIVRFRVVIEREVIDRIKLLMGENKKIAKKNRTEEDDQEAEFLEGKLDIYTKLYIALGEKKQDGVIKHLVHRIVMETKHTDFKIENLNRAIGYIGFTDGVYSFKKKALIPHSEAIELMMTQHVGYSYEEVLNVSEETIEKHKRFISQILPDISVRKWVLRRFHKAFQGWVEKLIIFFYNAKGNNGKTKLFELMDKTLGSGLFCKCSKKLLNPESSNNVSSNNEELMSIMYALLVVFSEPDPKRPLNMALLKELSGGDPITGTRKYKGKETFYAKGLIGILANFLPSMDSCDKASFNRIRCVPFEGEFVINPEEVDEANHKYLMDEEISEHFEEWKYAMMKMVLEAEEDVETPDKVLEHTRKYQERENTYTRFLKDAVEKKEGGCLRQSDLYREFKHWCKEEAIYSIKKSDFLDRIKDEFDMSSWVENTTVNGKKIKSSWLGYKLKSDDDYLFEDEEEFDEDTV